MSRLLWDSEHLGTAIRVGNHYEAKPKVVKKKKALTEAEYNAEGRKQRRIQNRKLRGWLPYAKR